MRWKGILYLRIRSLFSRQRVEGELDEEMRYHVERQIEANLAAGMAADEARYAALRAFGGMEQMKEDCRDARSLGWLEDLLRDLRFSMRALARTPSYTAIAILTLALGIAASAAAFSVLNAVLLRPLPYPDAERLVWLEGTALTSNNFSFWQQHAKSFDAIAAVDPGLADVATTNGPERVDSLVVSPEFFSMLGLHAAAGRLLVADDFRSGASVVMSNELATKLFGSPQAAVGRSVHLAGTGYYNESFEVVGTLDSPGPLPYDNHDLFLPLLPMPYPELCPIAARLRPGVSVEAARAEAEGIARGITAGKPPGHGWSALTMQTLKERVVGGSATMVRLVFLAALLVLFITCANVAHLVLARSTARRREIAVRMAMGASRGRLGRELLVESAVLSLAACSIGLWISTFAVRALIALTPYGVPRLESARADGAVFFFTAFTAVATAVVFALMPLFDTRNLDINHALKEASRQGTGAGHRRWLRSLLVTSEIAIACVVVVVAGLLTETFLTLRPSNLGFNPHQKLILRVGNTPSKNEDSIPLVTELQSQIAALPSVRGVAVTTNLPMSGVSWVPDVRIDGQLIRGGASHNAIHFRSVTANYLSLMRMPLVAGRGLDSADMAQRLPVAVVNQEFAQRIYGGASPLGRSVTVVGGGAPNLHELTIVGMVANGRVFGKLAGPLPELYLPFTVAPYRGFWLVVETAADPLIIANDVRGMVRRAAPDATITALQTMDQMVEHSVAEPRFDAWLLGLLAALAVVLALAGIYAVMSYSVAQRTHEMGIRIALGARDPDLLRAVMASALVFALLGIAIGVGAALVVSGAMRAILFGIAPTDPRSYAVAAGLLAALAMAASYVPARRAAKVDPMVALRNE